MPPSLWTEKQDDILRREWPTGIPASQIATLIPGKSRNAVIGRAHRLKLGKRSEEFAKVASKYTPGSGKNKSKTPRKRKRGSTPQEGIMKKLAAPIRIPVHKPITDRPPITIAQLGKHTCRAIVGHGGPPHYLAVYCGDQTFADKSFCEGHCALFFDYERKRRYR